MKCVSIITKKFDRLTWLKLSRTLVTLKSLNLISEFAKNLRTLDLYDARYLPIFLNSACNEIRRK